MKMVDDRTTEQRFTHRHLLGGTDPWMSGWGGAEGGKSYAFWACTPADIDACRKMVMSRGDLKRVRHVMDNGGNIRYRPRGAGHCHVYVFKGRKT